MPARKINLLNEQTASIREISGLEGEIFSNKIDFLLFCLDQVVKFGGGEIVEDFLKKRTRSVAHFCQLLSGGRGFDLAQVADIVGDIAFDMIFSCYSHEVE